jgi:hypothetical protein
VNWYVKLSNRMLAFTPSKRTLFFNIIANYERGGIQLIDTLQTINNLKTITVVPDVAEICLSSIDDKEPFAAQAERLGYFTKTESALLTIGERFNKLGPMIGLIISRMEEAGSAFNKMVMGKMGNVLTVLVMIAFYQMLEPLTRLSTEKFSAVTSANFIIDNALIIAIIVAMIVLTYLLLRKHATGNTRQALKSLGFFKVKDMETEYTFLSIVAPLAQASVSQDEIYESLISILDTEPDLTERLITARNNLERMPFESSLAYIVSELSHVTILSKAPSGALDEIGEGCDVAKGVLLDNITILTKTLSFILDAVLYSALLYFALPLIILSMGGGISL